MHAAEVRLCEVSAQGTVMPTTEYREESFLGEGSQDDRC